MTIKQTGDCPLNFSQAGIFLVSRYIPCWFRTDRKKKEEKFLRKIDFFFELFWQIFGWKFSFAKSAFFFNFLFSSIRIAHFALHL